MTGIVQTSFLNFKIKGLIVKEPIVVDWFRYFVNNENLIEFRWLNQGELISFLRFVKKNKRNFLGFPYILPSVNHLMPIIDIYKRIIIKEELFSPYFILDRHSFSQKLELRSWANNTILVRPEDGAVVEYDLNFPLVGLVQ